MGILNIYHMDIEEFINAKSYESNRLNHFNLSVMVDDDFMKAVEKDEEVFLHHPVYNEHGKIEKDPSKWQYSKKISAKYLWDLIMRKAYDNGEPGIFFYDNLNRDNNLNYIENIVCTNPCSEYIAGTVYGNNPITNEPLESEDYGGACNLGSIFLHNMVKKPFTSEAAVDYDKLNMAITYGVQMLDSIIDINKFPDEIYKNYQQSFRTIGLGVTGLADMLVMLNMKYDTEEARDFVDDLFDYIALNAYKASVELAKNKSPFPFIDKKKIANSHFISKHMTTSKRSEEWVNLQKDVLEYGIRNARILSVAPTGTLSLTFGNNCSSGIEPIFSLSYDRKVKIGGQSDDDIQIVKMQDYAYYLWEKLKSDDNIVTEDKFVTALNIDVNDHVDMLAKIAYHVDMSVSKCVAKGTRIQTNKGILNIEDLGFAKGEDKFDKPIDDLMVKDHNGDWKKVVSHYSGGIKPTKKIKLSNGLVIESSLPHKFMGIDGEWISANDLLVGDKILYRTEEYSDLKSQKITFDVEASKNSKEIVIPNTMSDDFALFLGMMVADGSICESSGAVKITTANDDIINLFIELCQKIFKKKCSIIKDKRTKNTVSVGFNSRHCARFIRSLIGNNCIDKHTPKEILTGTKSEMLNFIKGVTLDGYLSKNRLVIYEGYSKQLRNDIASMCAYLGVEYHLSEKKVKNGRLSKIAYNITISNNIIKTLEDRKNIKKSINKKRIPVPESLRNTKLSTKDKHYSLVRKIKQNDMEDMLEINANNMDLKHNKNYVLSVISIENSVNEVYDIEVEDTHSYLIDGVISHNTINVPEEYSFEKTKDIYARCWKAGIKGCTIFRPNELRQGILIDNNSRPKEKENKFTELKRGDIVQVNDDVIGKKRRVVSGCGVLHVCAYFDPENGNLSECYLSKGSLGGCQSFMVALSRMISLSSRAGVDIYSIVDQLGSSTTCPSYAVRRATKNDTSKGNSCPAAVGNALLEMYLEVQDELGFNDIDSDEQIDVTHDLKSVKETIKNTNNIKCPVCKEPLFFEGGCIQCKGCGWSKCE